MRDYLLLKEITITVEYLPRVFNQEADFKSRSMKDSSESELKPQIFQALCNIRETPDIDLFVSQVSHQVLVINFLENGPIQQGGMYFKRHGNTRGGMLFHLST